MAERRLTSKDVFAYFRPDQMHKLSNAAETYHLKAGDMVYRRGEPAEHFFILVRGEVSLRLPGKAGVSIPIDKIGDGAMFGRSFAFAIGTYILNAQCVEDSEILRIRTSVLKELMDDDCKMGYIVQSLTSQIYFERYIETMRKLQAIVMQIPVDVD